MPRDQLPRLAVEPFHRGILGEAVGVIEREDAFFRREPGAGAIGGGLDDAHPALRQFGRPLGAIGGAAEDQRVGKAGDAEPDPALRLGLACLGIERKAGDVDDIVEKADGGPDQLRQARLIELCLIAERVRTSRARLIEPSRHAP